MTRYVYLSEGPWNGESVPLVNVGPEIRLPAQRALSHNGLPVSPGCFVVYEHRPGPHPMTYAYVRNEEAPQSHAADLVDIWALGQFPPKYAGFAVDVGAYDGESTSNTYTLEKCGWTVLCVEPMDRVQDELCSRRKLVEHAACADYDGTGTLHINVAGPPGYTALRVDPAIATMVKSGWEDQPIPVWTLNTLLAKYEFPRLDVLSIDTEGTELDVLKGLDIAAWKPQAIIAESWNSSSPVVRYLAGFGYERVGRRFVNDMFLLG